MSENKYADPGYWHDAFLKATAQIARDQPLVVAAERLAERWDENGAECDQETDHMLAVLSHVVDVRRRALVIP